jgi:NhaA family Na+:H+ antiporter
MSEPDSAGIPLFGKLQAQLEAFVRLEAAGGILLIGAMLLALLVVNSPLAGLYQAFLALEGELRVGNLAVEKPVALWVNDFWMAIFFFMVGLEIKSELIGGHLSDRSRVVLPVIGALGGMLVPALVYVAFNHDNPQAMYGWAIPMATDIAFALGVMSLLGSRVPVGAKIFLMTLAILDDLGAIIVIALFYTANLSVLSLSLAAFFIMLLVLLNRAGVKRIAPYILVGICLWVCVLKSGVHATLAGVITALCIPWLGKDDSEDEPVNRLIEALHPWVAFAILPGFAFVNTGISFAGMEPALLLSGVPLGITLGLFAGKQLGVFGFSCLALKLGIARCPEGVSMLHLYGVALLCGIGFTMSIFISGLAFEEVGSGYGGIDRLAIMLASFLSALAGWLVFRFAPRTTT